MNNRESTLYRHFDADNNLLYVGISLSAYQRFAQHKRHSKWAGQSVRMEMERFEDRKAAMAAEELAIRKEKPKFNITHNNTGDRSLTEKGWSDKGWNTGLREMSEWFYSNNFNNVVSLGFVLVSLDAGNIKHLLRCPIVDEKFDGLRMTARNDCPEAPESIACDFYQLIGPIWRSLEDDYFLEITVPVQNLNIIFSTLDIKQSRGTFNEGLKWLQEAMEIYSIWLGWRYIGADQTWGGTKGSVPLLTGGLLVISLKKKRGLDAYLEYITRNLTPIDELSLPVSLPFL